MTFFILLVFRAVDPNDFITKLGLDPSVQQDAQEFSKLFQGVLESKLNSQINQVVRSMIQVSSILSLVSGQLTNLART